MMAEEILSGIKSLATQSPGFLGQEGYRLQLFKLCREAYRAGYHEASAPKLRGDAMAPRLEGSIPPAQLDHLRVTWDAWLYAFDRLDEDRVHLV
jgi:hypothetical protein